MERLAKYRCSLVEITGGEPLFQQETPNLISNLLDKDYQVLLETNGSFNVSNVDPRCRRIIDVKLPGSGEAHRNCLENLRILTDKDELKFVIGGNEDYLYAKNILNQVPKNILDKIVINFSPLYGKMEPGLLADWILNDHLPVRLNLQLHKIIWSSDMRGV